jgi:hypothetical protein
LAVRLRKIDRAVWLNIDPADRNCLAHRTFVDAKKAGERSA